MRRLGVGCRGFSLLELMCCLAVSAILLAVAVPSYQQYLQRGRLAEARAALLENSHFMQRWYAERGVFHQDSPLAWPALPVTQTPSFEIAFSSQAPSSDNVEQASFLIEASPKPGSGLAGVILRLDQDGNIRHCRYENGSERCDSA